MAGENEFEKNFGWLVRNASNVKKMLDEVAILATSEIQENFRAGGRPEKWEQSSRVKTFGGKTLWDSANLQRGFANKIDTKEGSVTIGPTRMGREKNQTTDPRAMAFILYGGIIKPKNGEYLIFKVPSRSRTVNKKTGKELKKAQKEYTFASVRQVIGKPHNYLYLSPEFYKRVENIVAEQIANLQE